MQQTTDNHAVAKSGEKKKLPGRLHGSSWITLQTIQAQRLVDGRAAGKGKVFIVGLNQFNRRVGGLFHRARFDDPYVDSWLLEIEAVIATAETELQALRADVEARLEVMPSGLQVSVASSENPTRVELNFGNPYAFAAARLIAKLDELACSTLTARHIGALDRNTAEAITGKAGRAVRRVLSSANNYKFGAIASREDMRQGNAKSIAAIKQFGELAEDVLNGTRRPRMAPALETFSYGSSVSFAPASAVKVTVKRSVSTQQSTSTVAAAPKPPVQAPAAVAEQLMPQQPVAPAQTAVRRPVPSPAVLEESDSGALL